MVINTNKIVYCIILILLISNIFFGYKLYNEKERKIVETEVFDENNGLYTNLNYDEEISSLKKKNKELYDSIKVYKDEIDYLIQFKYTKEYNSGKVEVIEEDTINDKKIEIYEYSNSTNDTLKYNLKIGSKVEPNWYSLDFVLSENFTITNKKFEDLNKTEIKTDNGGVIDNTIIINKKKNSFLDNVAIGPSITCGYDFAKKEPEFIVGFSITYDITDMLRKKK